jgi:hypothetical protein
MRTSNGAYTIETVAPQAEEPSLATDSTSSPHLSFYDMSARMIAYAHRTASAWSTENVDTSDASYHANGIALDGNDRPHLCYEQIGSDGYGILGYAARSAGGTWNRGGPSFPKDNPGGWCSIAVDHGGQPHISHGTGLSTWYSRLVGATWVNMMIDEYGVGPTFTSIALDANDAVRMSYFYFSEHQLRYAWQK